MRTVSSPHRDHLAQFWQRYGATQSGRGPKHSIVYAALSAAIADGYWSAGSKLPTEAELVSCTGFSLGTVQRAMRTLAEHGIVERYRRSGTFVANRRRQLHSPWHCRFLDDDGVSFLPVFSIVIDRSVTRRQGPWTAPLQQEVGHEIVRIDRHMEINSEFTVYSEFYLRADRFPQFLEVSPDDLSGADLKKRMIDSIGAPLTAIREQLRVGRFPRRICREIDVPDDTLGMHIQAAAYASGDQAVYYQELYVPPTDRRLYLDNRMPLP